MLRNAIKYNPWHRTLLMALVPAIAALGAVLKATPGLAQTSVSAPVSTTANASATAPSATPVIPKVAIPASDAKCMECHDDLVEEGVAHVAMEKGCKTCHGGIDGTVRPHKLTGRFPFGLTSPPAELCVTCHEKSKFRKVSTHTALDKGCVSCHEAHASKHKKLLKTAATGLCHTCHEKKQFSGKYVHSPFKSGNCGSCHDAHSSSHTALLKKPPAEICLECHDDIKEAPHVVAGFSRNGHPIGDEKRPQTVEDPLRPGKPFSCASCHDAHTSNFNQMLRFDPKGPAGFCQKCHRM